MAVSIAEPPPTATTASKGPASRAKAIASSIEASVGSTRAPAKTVTSSPRARIALGDPLGVAGRGDARVGHEQDATRRRLPPWHELLDVPADLGARAAAELQAGRGIGEDGLASR